MKRMPRATFTVTQRRFIREYFESYLEGSAETNEKCFQYIFGL